MESKPKRINLLVTPEQHKRWKIAAIQVGKTLHQFIVDKVQQPQPGQPAEAKDQ